MNYFVDNMFDMKTLVVPMVLFYIIDIVVIHENKGLLQSSIPILHDILNLIYNIVSNIIYDEYHSKAIAHTLIFGSLVVVGYSFVEKYNLFNLKDKKVEIKI